MAKLAICGGDKIINHKFPQFPKVNQEMENIIMEVLHSGLWGYDTERDNEDNYLKKMEREISSFMGCNYTLGVSSCSGALDIAIRSLGIRNGDEVIVSPYTYFASAACIMNSGGIPIFADIDCKTWNISPDEIIKKITPRTKAIVVVHFGGVSANMDEIMGIAQKYNLKVIEDAAHSFGAKWRDQFTGTIGDIGCFSFQQAKNVIAGEGGAFVTDNREFFEKAYSYMMLGRKYKEKKWYQHHCLGWNYRMTQFQAALVYSQLKDIKTMEDVRRKNAQKICKELSNIEGLIPVLGEEEEAQRVYHILGIRYKKEKWNNLSKKRFIYALNAEGIPCYGGYEYPLYRNPIFDKELNSDMFCKEAEELCQQAIWLPGKILLGDSTCTDNIISAFVKIYHNLNELVK